MRETSPVTSAGRTLDDRPAARARAEVAAEDTAGRGRGRMYPILLDLRGRICLVVGGGQVALRKASELLACGALVRAVAPEWAPAWAGLDDAPGLLRESRGFEPRDLEGAFLAFAATDDPEVQSELARAAAHVGVLHNVADVPDLCAFFVPATLRRGSLVVAVATEGRSPGFACAIRDRLADVLGPHLAEGLDRLAEGRRLAFERLAGDPRARREALARLVCPEAVEHLLAGRMDAFVEHWNRWRSAIPG
jgi:precorrin-2 dehydrogenase/sirohydrochlorin ferrochelatase